MNAQVLLRSSPMYRPHAWSAQIAPAMTANVPIGTRRSRPVESGPRVIAGSRFEPAPNPAAWLGRLFFHAGPHQYKTVKVPPTLYEPIATVSRWTWIQIQ